MTKIDEASAAELANAAKITECGQEGLNNKPERLEWLQDAGFGMFIHFGVDSQLGCVISHSLVGASADYQKRFYEELPKTFNPKNWNPAEIANLAKLAGMKYVVLTTKHHSGFCLWETKTTNFNIMNTPYGRDMINDYVKALREAGLGVGFYYSPEDWWFLRQEGLPIRRMCLDENGVSAGYSDSLAGDVKKRYEEYVRKQCTELMTKYGAIDVIFFDGQVGEPAKETCWKLQPDILITRGAIATPEQTLPGIPLAEAWEGCLTMGTQWSYKPTNEDYKSGTRLIEILIETRAKGGAMLLNIGPKSDGSVPEGQEARLREIALWHFANGEAVHNTRPWIVTNEGNLWFTRKKDENTVYVFITGEPDWERGGRKEFRIRSVKATESTKISVLGQSSTICEYSPGIDCSCRWEQTKDLTISVVRAQRLYNNSKWPNPLVVKLTNVEPGIIPSQIETGNIENVNGKICFNGNIVVLAENNSGMVFFEYRQRGGFVEELYSTEWLQTPEMKIDAPGMFSFEIADLPKGNYLFRACIIEDGFISHGDHVKFSVN